MISKLSEQTISSEFEFHWVSYTSGFVQNKPKLIK